MTQQMAARTIHGRFVNWTGGKGGNCPNDLKQEHLGYKETYPRYGCPKN